MLGLAWFGRFDMRGSGRTASSRLRLILASDQADCPSELIQSLREDMIGVISRYMEVEKDQVQLRMEPRLSETGTSRLLAVLYANIPVRSIPNKGIY